MRSHALWCSRQNLLRLSDMSTVEKVHQGGHVLSKARPHGR
ncbi:hypothetical protein [Hydrogenophaga sp.]